MSIGRVKLILLGLLAVVAVSASASATALGDVCTPKEGGGDVALCVENEELGSPTEHAPVPFTSSKKAGTTTKLEVLEGGPIIKCQKADSTGQFDSADGNIKDSVNPEVSDLVITFTECKVTNSATTEANCKVTEPIVADGGPTKDGIDGVFKSPVPSEVTFSPSEGTIFANIIIKNVGTKVCSVKTGAEGSNVTGTQKCSLPEGEVEKVKHDLVCATTGSALKFGATETPATFELTEEVALSGGEVNKKFSVIES